MRPILIALATALALTACQTGGTEGGSKVYRISAAKASKVQYRMLDSINELRQASGAGPVKLDSKLNAAASTHARDMSVQNRPWHFGSDGSSPIDRSNRAGFRGMFIGETISETFEDELQTLSAWMDKEDTRRIILDPRATSMGFSWHQERNGKLWWVLEMGRAGTLVPSS
ncbi:CAP domain-containing protein [Aliiroseovarius marinus]|uniref:CAP domain-containing protein n=1 Tax=Aliiroseovarius marinus TaxID=2500159 RepID=UPI003D7D26B5